MKALITGGMGYLGGCLAQHLATRTGFEIALGTRQTAVNIDWLPQATVFQINWNHPNDIRKVCVGIDTVIHAAGMNADDCSADPVEALAFNGVVTARLLHEAIRQGVRRFLYISTAHVYGSPLVDTITEETCPVNLHPYASSHRAGEDAVLAAHQRGEIEGIVIRISNAFGPPVRKEVKCWHLLINDLCRQAVSTGEMVLRSSGLQRRDFITMTDTCRAIEHLIQLPSEKIIKGLFNLGSEWSPTLWDVACLIRNCHATLTGEQPIQLSRKESFPGERILPLKYSIDRLRQTGFEITGSINDEIKTLIRFCQEQF